MFTILFLALALAMDAFAVALVKGAAAHARRRDALTLGVAFGLAQGLMPLVGWSLGIAFAGGFEAFDHWIAFVLLTILGGRMIVEARDPRAPATDRNAVTPLSLLVAAFATSIDAAAAGVTLPLLGSPVVAACLTIGVVTGALCAAGFLIGARAGAGIGRRAELAGGVVLIGLGLKILVEHLTA